MEIKNNQSGRTMIEMILYISLLIVLATGIAKTIGHGFDRYAIGRTSQQVNELKKSVIQYTATSEDYKEIACDDCTQDSDIYNPLKKNGFNKMLNDKAIPYDMKHRTHQLGGLIALGCATDISSSDVKNNYMFYITFNTIPKAACVEILTLGQFYSEGSEADTIIVNMGEGYEKAFQFKHSLFDIPNAIEITQHTLTMDQAVSACSQPNNTLTWIFS